MCNENLLFFKQSHWTDCSPATYTNIKVKPSTITFRRSIEKVIKPRNTTADFKRREYYMRDTFEDETTEWTQVDNGSCTGLVYTTTKQTVTWVTVPCNQTIYLTTFICQRDDLTSEKSQLEPVITAFYIDGIISKVFTPNLKSGLLRRSNCPTLFRVRCNHGMVHTLNQEHNSTFYKLSRAFPKLTNTTCSQKWKYICISHDQREELNGTIEDYYSISIHDGIGNLGKNTSFQCIDQSIVWNNTCYKVQGIPSEAKLSPRKHVEHYEWFDNIIGTYTCLSNGVNHVNCNQRLTIAPSTSQIPSTDCPAGLFTCNDRSCVHYTRVFDGNRDCLDGSDENSIVGVCQKTNKRHASGIYECKICRKPTCHCSEYFFQCHEGGCIHWEFVCDGLEHCQHGSDEVYCHTMDESQAPSAANRPPSLFYCKRSNHYISQDLVNDNIPDCNTILIREWVYDPNIFGLRTSHWTDNMQWRYNTEDEDILTGVALGLNREKNSLWVYCNALSHQQFYIYNFCQLEYDSEGHMKYCRSGEHLRFCETVQCSGRYKCPSSYCISVARVCDSVLDCQYGEDERDCPESPLFCPGMFRCTTGQCVHSDQLCDGHTDCPNSGEDESYCYIDPCPTSCLCFGQSMICTNANDIHAGGFKNIHVSGKIDTFPKLYNVSEILRFKLTQSSVKILAAELALPTVVSVDLSNNLIQGINLDFFLSATNLRQLNLSFNQLQDLNFNVFQTLVHLTDLDISYNHIKKIHTANIASLKALSVLSLRNNNITNLSIYVWQSQTLIDIRYNHMTHVVTHDKDGEQMTLNSLNVQTDNMYICCFSSHRKCVKGLAHITICALAEDNSGTVYSLTLALPASVGNLVLALYRLIQSSSAGKISLLSKNTVGFLIGIYGILTTAKDWAFDKSIIPTPGVGKHALCVFSANLQFLIFIVNLPIVADVGSLCKCL